LTKEDHEDISEAASTISNAKLFVEDAPARTVSQVASAARRIKRKHGLALIVIDYLQLLQPDDRTESRQEQVAKMARRLKCLAREMQVPVLCLSQLNRESEKQKGSNRPKLSNLRESGAIEQDADVVMFVHREEYYSVPGEALEEEHKGTAEIIVAKQRSGPTGSVKVAWHAKYTKFANLAYKTHDALDEFSGDNYDDF